MTNEEITNLFYTRANNEDVARLRRVDALVTALVQGRPLDIIAKSADAFYSVAENLDNARMSYLKRWAETGKEGAPSPFDIEKARTIVIEKLPSLLTPEQKVALRSIVSSADALIASVTPEQITAIISLLPPAMAVLAMRDVDRMRDSVIGARETVLAAIGPEEKTEESAKVETPSEPSP